MDGMFDSTINLGHIITLVGMLGVGWATISTIKATVLQLGQRMDGVEVDMKEMAKAVTMVAVQEERLSSMDKRLNLQGERIDEDRAAIGRLESSRLDQMTDRFNRLMTTMEK